MRPNLHRRHIQMLRLRYGFDTGEPMTLAEVAEVMDGVSRQSAQWTERYALKQIQAYPFLLDRTDFTDEQKAMLLAGEHPVSLHRVKWRSVERRYGQHMGAGAPWLDAKAQREPQSHRR